MSATTGSSRPPDETTATDGRPPAPPPGPNAPPPRGERRPVVTAVALIAVGVLWGLHILGVTLRWELLLPSALIVIGLGVLVGGRSAATRGLVTLGTVLAIVAVLTFLFPASPDVSAGDRTLTVASIDDLAERYELGAGELTVDLRQLDLPEGTTTLEVRVGAGQLLVRVPPEVTVVVDAQVGLGELDAFGTRVSGVAPQRRIVDDGDTRTLAIDGSVGLGQLEVTR
jgi:hypothetical protein